MAGNVMSVAYNQLNAMYGISMGTSNKYDAHKRSELRSTYNSIVKSNKESPLYKIKEGANVRKFAIDIKEQAHTGSFVACDYTLDYFMDCTCRTSAAEVQKPRVQRIMRTAFRKKSND